MGEYNMSYFAGVVAGILVGLVAIRLLMKFMRKDHSSKCKFDERQQLVRGVGYKYAFFTLLIYLALDMWLGSIVEMYVERMIISYVGICLAILVYASYAIWNEGYIALNENPRRVIITFIIVGGVNTATGVINVLSHNLVENGRVGQGAVGLILGITILILIVEMLVKNACTKESDER